MKRRPVTVYAPPEARELCTCTHRTITHRYMHGGTRLYCCVLGCLCQHYTPNTTRGTEQ